MLRRALLGVVPQRTRSRKRPPGLRSPAHVVRRFVPGETDRRRGGRDPAAGRAGTLGQHRPSRRGHHRPATGRSRSSPPTSSLLDAAERGRPDRRDRGVGQAVRARPAAGATETRSRLENAATDLLAPPARPARRSPSTWRTTRPPTRPWRSLGELRKDFPAPGGAAGLPAPDRGGLPRLAYAGSRVRLCKGAYAEPESVAFQIAHEIDLSYVRCLKILMAGEGYPMLATHDPDLIEIGSWLAARSWATARTLRVPDALRHPPDRAAAAGRPGTRCGSTCRTAPTGTATWSAGWPSAPPTWASSPARLISKN